MGCWILNEHNKRSRTVPFSAVPHPRELRCSGQLDECDLRRHPETLLARSWHCCLLLGVVWSVFSLGNTSIVFSRGYEKAVGFGFQHFNFKISYVATHQASKSHGDLLFLIYEVGMTPSLRSDYCTPSRRLEVGFEQLVIWGNWSSKNAGNIYHWWPMYTHTISYI